MKIRDWPLSWILFHFQHKHPINWKTIFNRDAPLDVEIGFGTGELLLALAEKNPDRNIVGIEKNTERICKTLLAIKKRQQLLPHLSLNNIRILEIDARLAFQRLFIPYSINNIYSLFPCPWPKTAHEKHRLFSNNFLKLLNNRLQNNGMVKIVTDSLPYSRWIKEQAKGCGFLIKSKITSAGYNTKFEQKWKQEGQKDFYEIELIKKEHIELRLPNMEKIMLRVYQIKEFNAHKLLLKNKTGKISVIFKEMIYDNNRDKAMIRTVVSEPELTQHFWIAVEKKRKYWHIYKAHGQNIFPTKGIALALEMVYNAAKEHL